MSDAEATTTVGDTDMEVEAPKEDRVELAAVTEEDIPIAVTEEATSVAAAVEEGAPAAATEEAASAAATKEAVTIEEKADAVGGKAAEEKKTEAAIEAKTEVSEWTCLKCNATNLGRRTTCPVCQTPRGGSEPIPAEGPDVDTSADAVDSPKEEEEPSASMGEDGGNNGEEDEGEGGDSNKSRKKNLGDPNRPKRVRTAYNLFLKDVRLELKAEFPDVHNNEIMKMISERWKNLSPEDRKRFDGEAEKDRIRHNAEMEDYVPPPNMGGSNTVKVASRKGVKRKLPGQPKRWKSPYIFFAEVCRPQLVEEHLGKEEKDGKKPKKMSPTETMSEIGLRWNAMGEEERKPFVGQSAADRKRYEEEMVVFLINRKHDMEEAEAGGEGDKYTEEEDDGWVIVKKDPMKEEADGPAPAPKKRKTSPSPKKMQKSSVGSSEKQLFQIAPPLDENLPMMEEEEMKNMIRVCRRLMGGANLPNLKKMCKALELSFLGTKRILQTRVELKLREIGFSDSDWSPTMQDLELNMEEFNEKFEGRIDRISTIEAMLAALVEVDE